MEHPSGEAAAQQQIPAVQPSSTLISEYSSATQQSETSTNSSEKMKRRLAQTSSLPQSLAEQRESFHSRRSFQSQTSSNISAYLSFGSSCQVQGVQGALSRCLKVVQAHKGHISALTVSQNFLYSASSSSNNVHVWKIPEFAEVHKFGRGDGAVKFLLAVDSHRMVSAHQDRKIRVWKRVSSPGPKEEHKLVATLPTLQNQFLTLVCSQTGCVQVRRHRRSLWIQHSDAISVLARCPEKNMLYSGSWDKSFKVWRLSDFRCLESVEAHADAVNALVISTAGYVYTGSADSKIKVWEQTLTSKKHVLVATLEGHRSAVNTLALSPDESVLYSGSSDRKIFLWEREDSANHMSLLGALRGHRQSVLSLAVCDDILCSGSADKTIRVWRRGINNVHSCLALLEGHLAPVKMVAIFSGAQYHDVDEGRETYVVHSGSLDSDIRVWLVSPDETMKQECSEASC